MHRDHWRNPSPDCPPSPPPAPRHLTQRELAARWNKSEASIERYRSDGVGPRFLKIGGAVRYRMEDVEAFEQECLYDSPRIRSSGGEPGFDDAPLPRAYQCGGRP